MTLLQLVEKPSTFSNVCDVVCDGFCGGRNVARAMPGVGGRCRGRRSGAYLGGGVVSKGKRGGRRHWAQRRAKLESAVNLLGRHSSLLADAVDGQFLLPMYTFTPETIPRRATEIPLEKWMGERPADLLYMQVAIQKVIQWIWIGKDSKRRLDGVLKSKTPVQVPFASLSDWLRCAHLYEAF